MTNSNNKIIYEEHRNHIKIYEKKTTNNFFLRLLKNIYLKFKLYHFTYKI